MPNVDLDTENKPHTFSTNCMQAMITDLLYKFELWSTAVITSLGKKILRRVSMELRRQTELLLDAGLGSLGIYKQMEERS